jgi:hypothetical protein
MTIKYTSMFNSKVLQNLDTIGNPIPGTREEVNPEANPATSKFKTTTPALHEVR